MLIGVAAWGICGTDQHIFEGDFFPTYPLIGGHELAGEIVAVGDDVENVTVGDRVAVDPAIFCGSCFYCRRAQGNHCLEWNAIGVTMNGGFDDRVVVPEAKVYPIGELSYEEAAFIEPLSCVVYGVGRIVVPVGASALIYGAGSIGLLMLQVLRRAGVAGATVVDVRAHKLDMAKRLGASDVLEAGPDADDQLKEVAPHGFVVVVDCTGVPSVAQHMFLHAASDAALLFFGVNPRDATIAVSPYDVFRKDLLIYGSFSLRSTFSRGLALMRERAVNVQALVSKNLSLERFPAALDLASSGEALKVQVHPEMYGRGACDIVPTIDRGDGEEW